MGNRTGIKPPPSSDLEGWRQVIHEGRLGDLRPEELAAAFQDLGDTDRKVWNALAKHLSGTIVGILYNKGLNPNLPDGGKEVIKKVHDTIFKALLKPSSKDGKMLRVGFGLIVGYRFKDALAQSYQEQISPVQKHMRTNGAKKADEEVEDLDEAVNEASKALRHETFASEEDVELSAEESSKETTKGDSTPPTFVVDEAEDDEIAPSRRQYDPTLLDGVETLDGALDVARILNSIPDYRKRQAFRYFMDGMPLKSSRTESIAKACGVSSKTAAKWIEEVKAFLQQNQEAKELLKMKVGAKP